MKKIFIKLFIVTAFLFIGSVAFGAATNCDIYCHVYPRISTPPVYIPNPTPTPQVNNCEINYFTASSTYVNSDSPVTLSWATNGYCNTGNISNSGNVNNIYSQVRTL